MVRIDDHDKTQLLVPKGFAHGFITRTDDASILWNDSEIGIDWKLDGATPILLGKDTKHPVVSKTKVKFYYNGK